MGMARGLLNPNLHMVELPTTPMEVPHILVELSGDSPEVTIMDTVRGPLNPNLTVMVLV